MKSEILKFPANIDPFINMWLVFNHNHNMDYDHYLIHMNFGVKKTRSPNPYDLDTLTHSHYEIVDKEQYFLSKIKYGL
jgi:hypothetical protein